MINDNLPFSKSADNNKDPILSELQSIITSDDQFLLEIGSGTGQHAVFFAAHFPHLKWQTSDLLVNHKIINAYREKANLRNILAPLEYEAGKTKLPYKKYHLIFTVNTFHIMSWKKVKTVLKSIHNSLVEGGQFIIYGPFNIDGEFTSESNKDFDGYLKASNPEMGIRNFNDIESNLIKTNMLLSKIIDMPSNNKFIVFTKITKEKS